MKNNSKKVTWGDVIHEAEVRSEIGATVERLKPIVESVVKAVDKCDATAIRRTRARLYKAIMKTATEIMDKWNLPPEHLTKLLEEEPCK